MIAEITKTTEASGPTVLVLYAENAEIVLATVSGINRGWLGGTFCSGTSSGKEAGI
jgi:hypothetical protein